MRFLFNLVSSVSLILFVAASAAWVRSYYAADQVTVRQPFGPGGERVAAQAKSELGVVTFTYGTERVRPHDLTKLERDAWTKPGVTHRERPLSPAKPQAAEMEAAQTQPASAQTQPASAQTQPAAARTALMASHTPAASALGRLIRFSHAPDPRTGVVRVGRQRVNVTTERTITVFPHWAMAGAFMVLPAMKYLFGPATRRRRLARQYSRANSYDAWALRTPPERRRQLPLSRMA